jgi:hypothetical protein
MGAYVAYLNPSLVKRIVHRLLADERPTEGRR